MCKYCKPLRRHVRKRWLLPIEYPCLCVANSRLAHPVKSCFRHTGSAQGHWRSIPRIPTGSQCCQLSPDPRPVLWAPVLLAHSNFSGSHCRWPLPALSPPSQYSGPQSCWICQYSRLLFAASVISPGAAATFASQKPKKSPKNNRKPRSRRLWAWGKGKRRVS